MSARVLVTGASGFVGRALVDALAGAGHRVRAASRQGAGAGFAAGVEAVSTGDYRAPVDWAPLLAGVDAVVHLAGIAHIGPAIGESEYDSVIRAATADLAAACSKAGVHRLVFMSSVRAQSGAAAEGVLTENDEPRPTEAYGRAKLRAEAAVRAAGVPWTILRPTMVYGAGAKGNLATLLRAADSPWPLPFAAIAGQRSLVSLDNLIAAVLFGLNSQAAAGQVYLVADPAPVTLPQIIAALRRGLGRPPRLYPVPPAFFARALKLAGGDDVWARIGGSLVVDPSKLIAAGWQPDANTLGALARIARKLNA
jgi:UDP-glucose 4-epimerase